MTTRWPAVPLSQAFLHVFAWSAFAFAAPLMNKLGDNAEFFVARGSGATDIAVVALVVYVGIPLLFWLAIAVAGIFHARARTAVFFATTAFLWFVSFIPLFHSVLGLPGWWAIGASAALAIVASVPLVRSERVRDALQIFCVCPLISAGAFLLQSSVTPLLSPPKTAPTGVLRSGAKPIDTIVFVVFDEFPLNALLNEQLEVDPTRYPNFSELSATSHWFQNASAVTTHTSLALPAILSGRYPTEATQVPSAYVHRQNLFTLLHGTYELDIHERISRLCPETVCEDVAGDRWKELRSWAGDLAVIYLWTVVPEEIDLGLPEIDNGWGDFLDDGNDWKEDKARRLNRLDRVIGSLGNRGRPTLHFAHHIVPHMPYQFFPSGKLYPARPSPRGYTRKKWSTDEYARLQAYQQFLLMTEFVDNQLGRMMKKLKDEGSFDNALIVVTADHGASFQPGQHRRGTYGMKHYYDEMLSIPLWIKLPGQTQGVVDTRNVESIDILPTIVDLAGMELPEPVEGQALFRENWSPRPTKKMVMGRKRNQEKVKEVDRSFEVLEFPVPTKLNRETVDWKIAHFGSGDHSLFAIGPQPERIGEIMEKLPKRQGCTVEFEPKVSRAWAEGQVSVPKGAKTLPAHLQGTLTCKPKGPKAMGAVLNGTLVATTYTFPRKKGKLGFEFLIPEEVFLPGKYQLKLVALDGDAKELPLQ